VTQLAISGLHKAFAGHRVLSGVDLDVPEGLLTAILGPSGSGKTTLLRVIVGFEHADNGTVRLGDRVIDGPGAYVPADKRRIGYVPQEGGLFPHLTVAANIGFGLPRRERPGWGRPGAGRPGVGRRRRGRGETTVDGLLDAVGLPGLGGRYPHQLSGGQQQRVALARALAIKPSLVLLDEPFSSLDASLRATIRADVTSLLRAAGTTAILVTHDQDEALSIADQVAVLRDGKIAQCGGPKDLYRNPADPDLARFVGEANLVDGTLTNGSVATVLGPLTARAATGGTLAPGPVTVLVRPEQIEISLANGSGGMAGRIVALGYHGHDAVVQVAPEQPNQPKRPDHPAPPGQPEQAEHRPGPAAVVVRTLGDCDLPAGSLVTLRVRGPVLAWPRSAGAAR
jgi:iron(III) transport system ATP-binding protein